MKSETEPLRSCKELAADLKREVRYVYAMRKRGFKMIAGRQTLSAALAFLATHPHPKSKSGGAKPSAN